MVPNAVTDARRLQNSVVSSRAILTTVFEQLVLYNDGRYQGSCFN